MGVAEGPARPRRSDATRNRALLLAAARTVFARDGLDASVDEIVAAAGVGIGTLYRHFPTRAALVDALFQERAGEIVAALEHALEGSAGEEALWRLLETMVALHRGDRVLKELLSRYPLGAERAAGLRAEIERICEVLLGRARDEGALRADFARADLAVLLWSLGPVLEATAETAPEAWRRHVGFLLDGLRPAAARPAAAPPLDAADLAAATEALRARRFPRAGHGAGGGDP